MSALLAKPNAGWGSLSDDYAGAYLAVKYLDHKIRNGTGANNSSGVSVTEGRKAPDDLDGQMQVQAEKSGLNQYRDFLEFDYGYGVGVTTDTTGSAIDDFLNDFEATDGQAYEIG